MNQKLENIMQSTIVKGATAGLIAMLLYMGASYVAKEYLPSASKAYCKIENCIENAITKGQPPYRR